MDISEMNIEKNISKLNRAFDSSLFGIANQIRFEAAKRIIDTDVNCSWKEIDLNRSMLVSVLERTPFERVEEVLKFNIAVTRAACERILHSGYSVIEKIGMYANAVEIGSRDFISPFDLQVVYKNLSAAKEKGFFFTPPSLAVRMVLASMHQAPCSETILDPAAGVGVFLAYHILLNPNVKCVIGIEIDKETTDLGEKLLQYVSSEMNRQITILMQCENFFDFFEREKEKTSVDLIIMNPPYGSVKTLSSDLTDSSTKAEMTAEGISELEKELKERTIDLASKLRLQFRDFGMNKGTLEFSKLFLVATLSLLSKEGTLVAITPSAWLGDEAGTDFRVKILNNGWINELWIIPEKAKIFKGVNQPTAVVVLRKQKTTCINVINPVLKIEDVDAKPESINLDSILSVSGSKCKFPICSVKELNLLVFLKRYKNIKDIPGIKNARGELDLTIHKAFVSSRETDCRLIRGDHIQGSALVSADQSEKAGYVQFDLFYDAIKTSEKAKFISCPRIAIPQCSYLEKKKRIEAAIVPCGVVLANSCNYLCVSETDDDDCALYYYWMLLNSSMVEWQFRIFSHNNHISNKEIDEFSCVPFEQLSEKNKKWIKEGPREYAFNAKQDAFIAVVYQLAMEEYELILKKLGIENINDYLLEYKQLVKNNISIPQHQLPSLSSLDKLMISYVEPGGNWTSIPETVPSKRLDQIREMAKTRGMVRTTYYSRLRFDQPAYTISTYFNRPGNGANIHPWEDRTLSSREAARLQSFPDSFIFEGNDSEIRTQIGNAVPPLLGYAIGNAIKKKVGKALKFCDVFAGAGGLSLGLELAGFEGVAALEINKAAAATFSRNHNPSIKTIVGDINDESIQRELLASIEEKITGDCPWVLAGGPPCQGFSTAGYRDENDIRNKLVDSYLKIINTTKPSIVIIENVPGILSMKNGDVIKGVFESLHRLGYVFHQTPWVLDAERYGVPQMRKRVIIVAARNKEYLPDLPEPLFNKCLGRREQYEEQQMAFDFASYPITVGEAFYGLPALMSVNQYYPDGADIDQTYSKWCSGEISVDEFLRMRR